MAIAMKNGSIIPVIWIEPYNFDHSFLYVILGDGSDMLVKISEIRYIEVGQVK